MKQSYRHQLTLCKLLLVLSILVGYSSNASAQQLGCDDYPFNGLFQMTCRESLGSMVENALLIEAINLAREERYFKRCVPQPKKKNRSLTKRCRTLKRAIGGYYNFTLRLLSSAILHGGSQSCRCEEVTDPILPTLTRQNPIGTPPVRSPFPF